MKICLLNNLYKPFSRGGAETVVEMMINDFRKENQEVFLITTKPKKAETPTKTDLKTYYLNSSYYNLNKINTFFRFGWHIANILNWKRSKKIKKILIAEKPNLIITHNLLGLGFRIPKIIKKLGIEHHHFLHDIQLLHPSGLMFHGKEKVINSIPSKIYQTLNRKSFSSVNKVISPSNWLLTEHRKRNFFPDSIKEIRPFNWPIKSSNQKSLNKFPKKTFLFVGQIEKHKGIFLLINAFKKLTDPNVKLIIIGDGKELERAKKEANDTNIEFMGRRKYEEIEKIMQQSYCLIVPSLCYENSPTIIYGAQSYNLPVIAADIGGIPEIIGENDKLFEPNNEEDLINKMKEI